LPEKRRNAHLTSGSRKVTVHLTQLYAVLVSKVPIAPPFECPSLFPVGSKVPSLNTLKRKEGLLKPNDVRSEQSQKKKFFVQSNLWTIGQLMEKPALPNGAPP
jgi:hypothetical protein